MQNRYEIEVRAQCPVNPSDTDLYAFTVESSSIIEVEKIIEFFAKNAREKEIFQEELTRRASVALGAKVTSVGWHSGVKVNLRGAVTIHYHGTPVTPLTALYELAGRCFCVSHATPQDVRRCHEIGQSVVLDNGAFSKWKIGRATNWPSFYEWADEWLCFPTTWAVIPDVIDGGEEQQDGLLTEWPFGDRGAPVWHMDESLDRLVALTEAWPKVCIGSTSVYADVLSEPWERRMDAAWDTIAKHHHRLPWIHMLRGMDCCGRRWPFASVDSTDVARNHNRQQNTPRKLADRWDKMQCGATWRVAPKQMELIDAPR